MSYRYVPVLICPLSVLFCEMSVRVFCPFSNWISFLNSWVLKVLYDMGDSAQRMVGLCVGVVTGDCKGGGQRRRDQLGGHGNDPGQRRRCPESEYKRGGSSSGWVPDIRSRQIRKDLIIGSRWDGAKAGLTEDPRFVLSTLENEIVLPEARTPL